MQEQIFTGLSIIIGVVIILLGLMKMLKQPMLIGYIIAGTVISFFLPHLLAENTSIQFFSNIGVSFLLFTIGLELNLKVIKDMGKTALIVGFLQIVLVTVLGFFAGKFFSFDSLTSFYIGIGLAFSSTIVTLKILGEKDSTNSVYGRLASGILVIQDIIAMLLILTITIIHKFSFTGSVTLFQDIGLIIAKMTALGVGLFIVSKYVIPPLTKKIAQSQEYLFLFSIGWCMILGTIFSKLGFSTEIGALIAGVTLASSAYRFEMMTRIKPLKDFFIVMFFVLLGSHVKFTGGTKTMGPIIIISLLVIVIKPLIITFVLGLMKHTHKNSFLTGSALGQMSEFSFLLVWLGMDFGHIKDQNVVSIVTLAGLISIIASSYITMHNEGIYKIFGRYINILPGLKNKKNETNGESYDTVLLGYGRIGSRLIENLKDKNRKCLVVDYNPETIEQLKKKGIPCLYGDATEMDLLSNINLKEVSVVIVTTKEFEGDLMILKTIKSINPNASVILVSSHSGEQALELYKNGADYVIMPYYIGAKHTSMLLEEYGRHQEKMMQERVKHIQMLSNG